MVYKKSEIERIGHVAFKAAQGRSKRLTSVEQGQCADQLRALARNDDRGVKAVSRREA